MKTILKGVDAKKHCNSILNNDGEKYYHPKDTHIKGGFWYENPNWIAFDNHSNDCTIEEFNSEAEAEKYANGIDAILPSGRTI